MSVHYKFKSSNSYDTISFDGLHISLRDLKKAIFHQKQIGKSSDFDLQITNAQSNEVYEDENALIPKNSSLIVVRVPLGAQERRTREKAESFQLQFPNFNKISNDNNELFNKFSKFADLTVIDASEEDKIKAAIVQSTVDYDQSNYIRVKGSNQVGELPANYRCYKCLQPGHWIKDCKLNAHQQESSVEIRKSTGIPRSFMVLVDGPEVPGAMMTNDGRYAVPNIDHEARKEASHKSADSVIIEKPSVPSDLTCGLCLDLFVDAVMIPCCGESYCDECIRNHLLESEDQQCPACKEVNVSPDNLIPNRYWRNYVKNFKNQTGYIRTVKQDSKSEIPSESESDKKDTNSSCHKSEEPESADDGTKKACVTASDPNKTGNAIHTIGGFVPRSIPPRTFSEDRRHGHSSLQKVNPPYISGEEPPPPGVSQVTQPPPLIHFPQSGGFCFEPSIPSARSDYSLDWHYRNYSSRPRQKTSYRSSGRPISPSNDSHSKDAMDLFLNKLKDKERKQRERRRSRSSSFSRSPSPRSQARSRSPILRSRARSPRPRSPRLARIRSPRLRAASPRRNHPKAHSPHFRLRSRSPRLRKSRSPTSRSRSRSPRIYNKRRSRSRSPLRSRSPSADSFRSYDNYRRGIQPPGTSPPKRTSPLRYSFLSRQHSKNSETRDSRDSSRGGVKSHQSVRDVPAHYLGSDYSQSGHEYSRYLDRHDRYSNKDRSDRTLTKRYDEYGNKDWEKVRDDEIRRRKEENERHYSNFNVDVHRDSQEKYRTEISALSAEEKGRDRARERGRDQLKRERDHQDYSEISEYKEHLSSHREVTPEKLSKSPIQDSGKKKKIDDSLKKKKKKKEKSKEKSVKKKDKSLLPNVDKKDGNEKPSEKVSLNDKDTNVDSEIVDLNQSGDITSSCSTEVVPAEADSTLKDVVLAPVPELSRWEKEDEASFGLTDRRHLDANDRSDIAGGSNQVTSEVLKRAENAIFTKSVNPIKDKKSKNLKDTSTKPKNRNTEKESSIKLSVRSSKSHILPSRPDNSHGKREKTRVIVSDKGRPRISAKERLGAKVDESSSRDIWLDKKDRSEKPSTNSVKEVDARILYREVSKESIKSRKVSVVKKEDLLKGSKERAVGKTEEESISRIEILDKQDHHNQAISNKRSLSSDRSVTSKIRAEEESNSSDDSKELAKKHKKKKKSKKKKKKKKKSKKISSESESFSSSDSESDEKKKKKSKHKKTKKHK